MENTIFLENKMQELIQEEINLLANKYIEEKTEEFKQELLKEKVGIATNIAKKLKVHIINSTNSKSVNINIAIQD